MNENIPICQHTEVHEKVVATHRSLMPDEETLYDLADLYKVFSDSTRIRILFALEQGEMCVCDVAALLGMTVSAVSHQLNTLRKSRLIVYRKNGKNVYYSLADDHVSALLDLALEHINE